MRTPPVLLCLLLIGSAGAQVTVAVWVGNFEGDSMREVSGVTGAAPIWHDLMIAARVVPGRQLWSPAPGAWYLTLRDARGLTLDRVLFTVR